MFTKHVLQMGLLDGADTGGGAPAEPVAEPEIATPVTADPTPIAEPIAPVAEPATPVVEFPEGLEDAVKNDPSLQVFVKDGKFNYANMMKSYVHAQKQMGKDKLVMPTDASTEEDWNNFYNKMGRPDLDGYELKSNLGEGQELDLEVMSGFKEVAHEAGILPRQAQAILNWFNETSVNAQKSSDERFQAQVVEDTEGLKKEWGDGFDRELTLSNRALKEFASDEEIQYLKDSGLSDDVKLVRIFNKIGKGLSEDTFEKESHGSFGMTPDEAQTKINDHFSNEGGPYLNPDHANHKTAVKEMLKLQEIMAKAS